MHAHSVPILYLKKKFLFEPLKERVYEDWEKYQKRTMKISIKIYLTS